MSCYFLIDTYIENGRAAYDEYIAKVRSIVEAHGGEYLIRSENVTPLSDKRTPQRVIIIRFPDRASLDRCFSSPEYREIAHMRSESVDARALIAEEE